MSIPNTASTRRQILKTLRVMNKTMRRQVLVWNPNQARDQLDATDLPEHSVVEIAELWDAMADIRDMADAIQEAAEAMRQAIEDGHDPDSNHESHERQATTGRAGRGT